MYCVVHSYYYCHGDESHKIGASEIYIFAICKRILYTINSMSHPVTFFTRMKLFLYVQLKQFNFETGSALNLVKEVGDGIISRLDSASNEKRFYLSNGVFLFLLLNFLLETNSGDRGEGPF